MQSRLEQFIEWLEQSKTHEDLQRATEELRELYDVKHIVYHWVNSKGERYGAGTYTPEWVNDILKWITCAWIRLLSGVCSGLTP